MTDRQRGIFDMTAAMLISGSIGWFVLASGRPVLEVVFWRCAIGAGRWRCCASGSGCSASGYRGRSWALRCLAASPSC